MSKLTIIIDKHEPYIDGNHIEHLYENFDVTYEEDGCTDGIATNCPTMKDALIALSEWLTNMIATYP